MSGCGGVSGVGVMWPSAPIATPVSPFATDTILLGRMTSTAYAAVYEDTIWLMDSLTTMTVVVAFTAIVLFTVKLALP